MATSPLSSRGPTSGRNCYVTPAFSGVPNKGDKIKSGCIGGKDKTVDMQPKEYHQKKSLKWCACIEKHPLNPPPPHGPFQKKGGGSETPHGIGFLRTPPPPAPEMSIALCPVHITTRVKNT